MKRLISYQEIPTIYSHYFINEGNLGLRLLNQMDVKGL
jgi:hypothetical protein